MISPHPRRRQEGYSRTKWKYRCKIAVYREFSAFVYNDRLFVLTPGVVFSFLCTLGQHAMHIGQDRDVRRLARYYPAVRMCCPGSDVCFDRGTVRTWYFFFCAGSMILTVSNAVLNWRGLWIEQLPNHCCTIFVFWTTKYSFCTLGRMANRVALSCSCQGQSLGWAESFSLNHCDQPLWG